MIITGSSDSVIIMFCGTCIPVILCGNPVAMLAILYLSCGCIGRSGRISTHQGPEREQQAEALEVERTTQTNFL